jgi:glutamate-1-semialdehyde 2,1-aminomutase
MAGLAGSATSMASARLYERASRHVPGGAHSNTRVRKPRPLFAVRAAGAYVWDADGTQFLDLQMGNASVSLGYARAEVDIAVIDAITSGVTTGVETAMAVDATEALAAAIPDCGMIRFANTGTEALMHAMAIARHVTGRTLVVKAEGAYHGWYDSLWVSTWASADELGPVSNPAAPPGSAGLAAGPDTTVVIPFNDVAATTGILRAHADKIAAVVVEPVMIDIGYVPATADYLSALRDLTKQLGIVLIFDELLTGFRLAPGGAREVYGIKPDLTTYGKAIGNGYPVAVVEGDPALMTTTDPGAGGPVGWVGTYNGHPTAVAATAAAVALLSDGKAQSELSGLNEELRAGFAELATRHGIAAVVPGEGGHFQPYFLDHEPVSYRDALRSNASRYETWRAAMESARILVPQRPLLHCAFSTAHTRADVSQVLEATDKAFLAMT